MQPFSIAADGSTVTFDLARSKNWQVTIGGNRTLKFLNAQKGDTLTVVIVQDSTGSRTVSWPTSVQWTSQVAPALTTVAGGVDVITLKFDGTVWRDIAGAPSRFPTRIVSVALATLTLVGGGSGMKYIFSNGNGGGPGAGGPAITQTIDIRSNSGAQVNGVINASGSFLTGSGKQVVGAITENPAQTLGSVVTKVRGGAKGTNASGSLVLNGAKGGQVCYADTDGVGYTMCSGNNGTQTCKVAVGNECP